MDKPKVHFILEHDLFNFLEVGKKASVVALDHPRLGCTRVFTSRIISINYEYKSFETLNSVYVASND